MAEKATIGFGRAAKAAMPVVLLLVTGIVSLIGWLTNMGDSAEETAQKVEEMQDRIGEIDNDISSIDSILTRIEELREKSYLTSDEMAELEEIQEDLIEIAPSAQKAFGDTAASIGQIEEAARGAKEELDNMRNSE